MKTKKKKQLTLYDVRRRHLLIRRKQRKSLIYRIGRVIRNSSLPKGKWPRSVQVDIIRLMRIAGMSADAAAALFAIKTSERIFKEIFKGKNRA